MMKSTLQNFSVVLFVAAVLGGAMFSSRHYFGVIYVDLGDGRGPAAIRKSYDVTGLEGLALSKKIHERLVGDAKILLREQDIGIELGQFATEVAKGRKQMACSVYDRVQMVFMGKDEATSGHAPEMLVEGPCRMAEDSPLWIAPIWIPVNEITSRPTTTAELNFFDDRKLSLRFSHMGEAWPKEWILDSIRLSDDDGGSDDIIILRSEIRQVAPDSILLTF